MRIWWISSRGKYTRVGLLTRELGVDLTTLHLKTMCYEMKDVENGSFNSNDLCDIWRTWKLVLGWIVYRILIRETSWKTGLHPMVMFGIGGVETSGSSPDSEDYPLCSSYRGIKLLVAWRHSFDSDFTVVWHISCLVHISMFYGIENNISSEELMHVRCLWMSSMKHDCQPTPPPPRLLLLD